MATNEDNTVRQVDLDAILDAALDDLDDSDDEKLDDESTAKNDDTINDKVASTSSKTTAKVSRNVLPSNATVKERSEKEPAPPNIPPELQSLNEDIPEEFQEMMKQMIQQGADDNPEVFLSTLENLMTEFEQNHTEECNNNPKTNKIAEKTGNNDEKDKSITDDDSNEKVKESVSRLIENMASPSTSSSTNMEGEEESEAMLSEMMKEFGKLNDSIPKNHDNKDSDGLEDKLMEGMMEQLLSKELMYEPMKQVSVKFPQWLRDNKSKLSSDEYERRHKQCECFHALIHVYDTDPNNTERLVMLMQQVQEFGQPPPDIVNDIAPGLQLDDDGMPVMDPAMMAQMMSSAGLGDGAEGEECIIQ